jgi:AcrR family transcriptional regulator
VEHAKRADIIAAVWTVIASKGIAGVSMRTVAAEAGVSVGLVQHYFGTKQRLVHAGAELMVQQASLWYDTIDAPPAESLRRLINHVIPATQAARLGAVIWHAYIAASLTDESIAGILTRAKQGQESEAIRLIRAIDRRAAAKPIASRLIAHADGLAAQVLFGALTPAAALRRIDDNIAAALAPRA